MDARVAEPPVRPAEDRATCAVCGSAEAPELMLGARDYLTGDGFAVRRCGGCGFGQTRPQPEDLAPYYPVRYRRYRRLASSLLQRFQRWRAGRWAARLGPAGRALEIGCGEGWMLRALQRRGWQVVGTERSAESARIPAEASGVPVFVGGLDALGPSARFNAVIMFHVLEHLADPVAVLRRCAALLAPGGAVIAAVPNWGSWQARWAGPRWFHLDVPRHLGHFSRRALSLAAERAGLRIARISHVSWEHDPYGWVQSALNRFGFPQNLLTKRLMGMPSERMAPWREAAMAVLIPLLAIPSLALAPLSWAAGAGAVMEVWAVKR